MSEDPENSGMSAMMIGMIIGGVVVLALIALVILGGAFYWLTPGPVMPPAAGGPAPIAVMDEAAAEPQIAAPAQPVKIVDPRKQLVGIWEAKNKDGGTAIMEFRDDGNLLLTDKRPGKADVAQ